MTLTWARHENAASGVDHLGLRIEDRDGKMGRSLIQGRGIHPGPITCGRACGCISPPEGVSIRLLERK